MPLDSVWCSWPSHSTQIKLTHRKNIDCVKGRGDAVSALMFLSILINGNAAC